MGQVKKKYKSPFSKEFWIDKGFSEEDAEYKRNSMRPIRCEYWLERGYNKEEAIRKAKETKESNNKKGAKKRGSMDLKYQRESSVRCKEYWIKQGYSESESVEKVKSVQRTFSLKKCIEKYGIEDGVIRFIDRQVQWQKTLNSKTDDEKVDINKKKNMYNIGNFDNIDELCEFYEKRTNKKLFLDIGQYVDYLNNVIFKENPAWKYMCPKFFINNKMKKTQKSVFEALDIEYDGVVSDQFTKTEYVSQGKYHTYNLWTEDGFLKSSYEIYFYENIKSKCPDVKMKIGQRYPNSNFKYDFLLDNQIYVEISPCYNMYEKIKEIIDVKKKVFECKVLTNIEEIDTFIENYGSNS